jgi:uncharacterized protein (TIGR01777 family)
LFGGSGLIGKSAAATLERDGVEITRYRRNRPKSGRAGADSTSIGESSATWDPPAGVINTAPLERADAVINLAGENLGDGVWTRAKKQRIWASRVDTTALLAKTLAGLTHKPSVLVNASAVGFYGDRAHEHVTEESERGSGFLAEMCEAWEAATLPASHAGIRVVNLRMGVVLTAEGGALAKMLPVFRRGLGGRFGDGEQAMPWISLTDAVGTLRFALMCKELHGPVNAVAPEQITNAQLTDALSRALAKPARIPVPAFALRLVLGEMATEMLLGSARVHPRKLEIAGYRFEYPRLDDALPALLAGAPLSEAVGSR